MCNAKGVSVRCAWGCPSHASGTQTPMASASPRKPKTPKKKTKGECQLCKLMGVHVMTLGEMDNKKAGHDVRNCPLKEKLAMHTKELLELGEVEERDDKIEYKFTSSILILDEMETLERKYASKDFKVEYPEKLEVVDLDQLVAHKKDIIELIRNKKKYDILEDKIKVFDFEAEAEKFGGYRERMMKRAREEKEEQERKKKKARPHSAGEPESKTSEEDGEGGEEGE